MILVKINDADTEREFRIEKETTTIGRSKKCDIKISEEKSSREHCAIKKVDDEYILEDFSSRNGTKVNGSGTCKQTLKPGDEIGIGKAKIIFRPDAVEVEPQIAEENDTPTATLEVIEGDNKGTKIPLEAATFSIGRNDANDLALPGGSASGYHAEIERTKTGFSITDLGSTNGTKVDGEKVIKIVLHNKAEIKIGSTILRFLQEGAAAEEDVFGTMVEDDSADIDFDINTSKPQSNSLVPIIIGVCVIVVFVFGASSFLSSDTQNTNTENETTLEMPRDSLIKNNWSFEEKETSTQPVPKWRATKHSQGVRVTTLRADEGSKNVGKNSKTALIINHSSASSPSNITQLEYDDIFQINRAKAYKLSGCVKAQSVANGSMHTLAITWGSPSTRIEKTFYINGVTQETAGWKDISGVLYPPSWATELKVNIVASGNRGSTMFDNITVVPVSKRSSIRAEETIQTGTILSTIMSTGEFSISKNSRRIIDSVKLLCVADDRTQSNQSLSVGQQITRKNNAVNTGGLIPEFASGGAVKYSQTTWAQNGGIQSKYSIDSAKLPIHLSNMGFAITVNTQASGAISTIINGEREIYTGDSAAFNVEEILFGTDANTVAIQFSLPVTVSIYPPNIIYAVVSDVNLTPSNPQAIELGVFTTPQYIRKNAIQQATNAKQFLKDGNTAEAYDEYSKLLKEASEIPDLKELAQNALNNIDNSAKIEIGKVVSIVDSIEQSVSRGVDTSRQENAFNNAIEKVAAKWNNVSNYSETLQTLRDRVSTAEVASSKNEESKLAQKLLTMATTASTSNPLLAKTYLTRIINSYPNTLEAAKAEGLLQSLAEISAREDDFKERKEKLRKQVRMWLADTQRGAHKVMPEITSLLEVHPDDEDLLSWKAAFSQ